MLKWMRSSLPARAGLAVMLIAVLALASAISAGLIAWLSEDDAAAINTAGSLRMATYQLSWQLEANEPREQIDALVNNFEQRLQQQPTCTRCWRAIPARRCRAPTSNCKATGTTTCARHWSTAMIAGSFATGRCLRRTAQALRAVAAETERTQAELAAEHPGRFPVYYRADSADRHVRAADRRHHPAAVPDQRH